MRRLCYLSNESIATRRNGLWRSKGYKESNTTYHDLLINLIYCILYFHCPVSFEAFGCGWNFEVSPVCVVLSMDPLIGAISAGCAIVLKPSEVAPAMSALLAKLIPLYLDSSLIRVVEGAIPETQALLQQKWDKIFYTGSYTFDNNLVKLSLATLPDHFIKDVVCMWNTAEFFVYPWVIRLFWNLNHHFWNHLIKNSFSW